MAPYLPDEIIQAIIKESVDRFDIEINLDALAKGRLYLHAVDQLKDLRLASKFFNEEVLRVVKSKYSGKLVFKHVDDLSHFVWINSDDWPYSLDRNQDNWCFTTKWEVKGSFQKAWDNELIGDKTTELEIHDNYQDSNYDSTRPLPDFILSLSNREEARKCEEDEEDEEDYEYQERIRTSDVLPQLQTIDWWFLSHSFWVDREEKESIVEKSRKYLEPWLKQRPGRVLRVHYSESRPTALAWTEWTKDLTTEVTSPWSIKTTEKPAGTTEGKRQSIDNNWDARVRRTNSPFLSYYNDIRTS